MSGSQLPYNQSFLGKLQQCSTKDSWGRMLDLADNVDEIKLIHKEIDNIKLVAIAIKTGCYSGGQTRTLIAFSSLTQDQIDQLKGDSLKFSDLTQDQIDQLKGGGMNILGERSDPIASWPNGIKEQDAYVTADGFSGHDDNGTPVIGGRNVIVWSNRKWVTTGKWNLADYKPSLIKGIKKIVDILNLQGESVGSLYISEDSGSDSHGSAVNKNDLIYYEGSGKWKTLGGLRGLDSKIMGSDTIANILVKTASSNVGEIWVADTSGFDSVGTKVNEGDGVSFTGNSWVNIGRIRGKSIKNYGIKTIENIKAIPLPEKGDFAFSSNVGSDGYGKVVNKSEILIHDGIKWVASGVISSQYSERTQMEPVNTLMMKTNAIDGFVYVSSDTLQVGLGQPNGSVKFKLTSTINILKV